MEQCYRKFKKIEEEKKEKTVWTVQEFTYWATWQDRHNYFFEKLEDWLEWNKYLDYYWSGVWE
jgi:hypothetical protein